MKLIETQVICFEKFFSKFKNIESISTVVHDYNEMKQEIKKSINRVVYLEELTKFEKRDRGLAVADLMRGAYTSSLDAMSTRFRAFNKQQADQALGAFSKVAVETEEQSNHQSKDRSRGLSATRNIQTKLPLAPVSNSRSHLAHKNGSRVASSAVGLRIQKGTSSAALIKSRLNEPAIPMRPQIANSNTNGQKNTIVN